MLYASLDVVGALVSGNGIAKGQELLFFSATETVSGLKETLPNVLEQILSVLPI